MAKSYHISRKDLGTSVMLTAKVPEDTNIEECEVTPRVCFTSHIENSLLAFMGVADLSLMNILEELCLDRDDGLLRNPVIYMTERVLTSPPDINVADFKDSGELWSLTDIHVDRIGYIDLLSLMDGILRVTEYSHTDIPEYVISDSIDEYDIKDNRKRLDKPLIKFK